jgi:hypothetical protein
MLDVLEGVYAAAAAAIGVGISGRAAQSVAARRVLWATSLAAALEIFRTANSDRVSRGGIVVVHDAEVARVIAVALAADESAVSPVAPGALACP